MRAALCSALLVIATPIAAQQAGAAVAPAEIVASGNGEARVTPDRATIYIGVQTTAQTAAQAGTANTRKQRAVMDTLRALGVPNELISTVNYSVSPQQSFQPDKGDKVPRVVGYMVTNTVRVEVRQLDRLGNLIDAALARGGNEISSLEFSASNIDDARRTALAAAVAQARGDAEVLAKSAGGHLGELVELSTGGQRGPQPLYAVALSAVREAATPVNPGEQRVNVAIVARWRFISDVK